MLDKLHNFITSKATSEEKGSQALHSDSEKMMSLWIILLCLLFDPLSAYEGGFCSIQGILQEEQCFQCKNITCNKSTAEEEKTAPNTTNIYLFTHKDQTSPECLHNCNYELPLNTAYNESCKSVIILHGYLEGPCRVAWPREMMYQLFCRECCLNVFLVDMTWGNFPDLKQTSDNLPEMVKPVYTVVNNIIKTTSQTGCCFHCIGLSFGAHGCGIIGKNVPNFYRITGLDPAFYARPPDERLNYTDATFVDVIHTGSSKCLFYGFGDITPRGHLDAYFNGGAIQPNCYLYVLEAFAKGDIFIAVLTLIPQICYHEFSTRYYIASINPCGCQFVGFRSPDCKSLKNYNQQMIDEKLTQCAANNTNCDCVVVGYDASCYWNCGNTTNNLYYVKTEFQCPYCKKYNINFDQGKLLCSSSDGKVSNCTNCHCNNTDVENSCCETNSTKIYDAGLLDLFSSFMTKFLEVITPTYEC